MELVLGKIALAVLFVFAVVCAFDGWQDISARQPAVEIDVTAADRAEGIMLAL
jgi:hypothetical protein